MSVSVGFGLITCQRVPADARRTDDVYRDAIGYASRAEELGFDSVWVAEHHFIDDGHLPSPLVLLAAMAATTSRITLGTAVLLAPLHHPVRLAEDAAVLDVISGGRLVLGLGAGWRQEELDAYGVTVGQRHRRLRRAVDVVRRASRGEGVFDDEDREVLITPRPAVPIAVWVGGHGPRTLAFAALGADGYVAAAGRTTTPATLSEAVDSVRQTRREAGLADSGFTFATYVPVFASTEPNPWALVAPHHRIMQAKYDEMRSRARFVPGGGAPGWSATIATEAEVPEIICGTPAAVVDRLRPYVEVLGHEAHLILRAHFPGMPRALERRSMELIGEYVVPQLRAM